jgi:AraC-like DNA-binding protein
MAHPAVAEYPPGARLPTRVIHDYEFVWMQQGRARYVADDEWELTPGRLLLIPPGVRHGFQWDRDGPSRHGYVHFELGRRRRTDRAVVCRMSSHDPLDGLCAYLLWLGRAEPDGWQTRVDETLLFMVGLVTSRALPADEPAPMPAPVSSAIGHLRQTWAVMPLRRLTVHELAAAAHVSRGYLNRLFQGSFAVSVAAGLERLRCSRAESLLLRTDLPLGSIAHACGYADVFHFSHRFRHLHGLAPGRYRTADRPRPSVLDDDGTRRLAHLVWD